MADIYRLGWANDFKTWFFVSYDLRRCYVMFFLNLGGWRGWEGAVAKVYEDAILPAATSESHREDTEKVSQPTIGSLLPRFSPNPWSTPPPFRERLSATEMLQVRKVMEHVFEKILNTAENPLADAPPVPQQMPIPANLEERLELFCNDQVC